jgi:hypothetical protein
MNLSPNGKSKATAIRAQWKPYSRTNEARWFRLQVSVPPSAVIEELRNGKILSLFREELTAWLKS